jgi:Prokaryotic phospholipase A2
MAILANLVVAATTFLAAPLGSLNDPSGQLRSVEHLTFEVPLSTFVAARAARAPVQLDWSSDGCSTPFDVGLGDTGRSFNFRHACWRHDFAYRNHRRLGRWDSVVRLRIDTRFHGDMLADCAPRPWTQRLTCQAWAATYYRAVRVAGGP